LVDNGWIVVAGAIVGGGLTGTLALLQVRSQHRFDTFKANADHDWSEELAAKERDHAIRTRRRDELLQIYTRYQLAADRLENAIRQLAEVGVPAASDEVGGSTLKVPADKDQEPESVRKEHSRRLRNIKLEGYEAAQDEYDRVCELIKLVAPTNTMETAIRQRQLFNSFVVEALDGRYNHKANYEAIIEAADPVLRAMRLDLGSPN
jgi:hypothetical protein